LLLDTLLGKIVEAAGKRKFEVIGSARRQFVAVEAI